jgi:hypothetical protein
MIRSKEKTSSTTKLRSLTLVGGGYSDRHEVIHLAQSIYMNPLDKMALHQHRKNRLCHIRMATMADRTVRLEIPMHRLMDQRISQSGSLVHQIHLIDILSRHHQGILTLSHQPSRIIQRQRLKQ